MTVLMWVLVIAATVVVTAVAIVVIALIVIAAVPAVVKLILNGQQNDARATVWVVTCPKTGQLSVIDVSSRSISRNTEVIDCFNHQKLAGCGQRCLAQIWQQLPAEPQFAAKRAPQG